MAISRRGLQIMNPNCLALAIALSLLLVVSSAKVFFEERFDGTVFYPVFDLDQSYRGFGFRCFSFAGI